MICGFLVIFPAISSLLPTVALQNVKTLYIDPKRELRNHYQEVINSPEFARRYPERKKQIDNFNFVTLDSSLPSNHGVLDPIVVLDKEQAVEVNIEGFDIL